MICQKCGQTSPGDAVFCGACGNRLQGQIPQQPAPTTVPIRPNSYVPQQPITYAPQTVYTPTYVMPALAVDTPAVQVIKQIGASPLFLCAAILFSISLFFTLISNLSFSIYSPVFQELFYEFSYSDLTVFSAFFKIGAVFGMIPSILYAVAYWLCYGACKNPTTGIKTGGLTMLKILAIISLVSLCATAALMAVVMLIMIITAGASMHAYGVYSDEAAIAVPVLLILTVFMLAVFAFAIFYSVMVLKTIRTITQTAKSGVASDKISRFVMAMCFIGAGSSLISGLSAVAFTGVWAVFASLCMGTCYLLFGILMMRYRSAMTALMAPTYPPYTVAVPVPQAPQAAMATTVSVPQHPNAAVVPSDQKATTDADQEMPDNQ